VRISLIVAVSANRVIGADGGLPWRLPEDLRRFRQITMGKPIVMGRRTFESIGRPLPGRRNIVLTRSADFHADGFEVVATIDAALECAGDAEELMVIGGGDVYAQFLPRADRVYRTRVRAEVSGDTFFPELDMRQWRVVDSEAYPAAEDGEYAFTIETLDRIRG
jgi:dihydrofolate reductase